MVNQIEQAYFWYRERNSEFADRWFQGLMNAIATLQEKPQRCALALEHEIFPKAKIYTECFLLFEEQQFTCYMFAIVLKHH
jgi:hypothetical protein